MVTSIYNAEDYSRPADRNEMTFGRSVSVCLYVSVYPSVRLSVCVLVMSVLLSGFDCFLAQFNPFGFPRVLNAARS